MTTIAILFMSASVLSVTVLAGWCYYRVLTRPRRDENAQGLEQRNGHS